MPRTKLTIDLPEPCAAPWAEMQPVAGGRHCENCAKTVVDLSNATDQQLIDFFSRKNAAGTCCRLREDQLKRRIQDAPHRSLRSVIWQRVAALILVAHVLVTDTVAQTAKTLHHNVRPSAKAKKPAQVYVNGRIVGLQADGSSWGYAPIAFRIGDSVTVNVIPDSNLRFRIPLPHGVTDARISWAMQDVGGGIILDDSVIANAALLASGIELQWQAPETMLAATVRTAVHRQVLGGLPAIHHEPAVPARTFFRRVFKRPHRTQR